LDTWASCVNLVDMATQAVEATATSAPDAPARRWRDRKLLLWPLALIVPLIPLRTVALAGEGAHPVLWFLAPIVVFIVFPIIDTVAGLDRSYPPESEVPRLDSSRWHRWITSAYTSIHYLSLVV